MAAGETNNFEEPDLPLVDDAVENEEDFGAQYVQPLPSSLPSRPFQPWHRPRKQLVRRQQWVSSFAEVVDDVLRADSNREVVRYIGLPGGDLIDIRLFADVCADKDRQLAYLGFDRSAGDSSVDGLYLNVARDELLRSGSVHRSSLVMRDDFSTLGELSSLAYKEANSFSYDVVNLDLCGSATNMPAGESETLYKALDNLLHIQSRREDPWILLLTATFDREGQSSAGLENVEKLYRELRADLEECPEAKEVALQLFTQDGQPGLPDLEACDDKYYSLLHILGFLSWFSRIARAVRPAYVKCLSIMSYRLHKDRPAPDMFSLAIRINPRSRATPDPAELLPKPRTSPEGDCAALGQQVARMERVVDVDARLRDDRELFTLMRDEMADILEALKYSRSEYLNSPYSKHIWDL